MRRSRQKNEEGDGRDEVNVRGAAARDRHVEGNGPNAAHDGAAAGRAWEEQKRDAADGRGAAAAAQVDAAAGP